MCVFLGVCACVYTKASTVYLVQASMITHAGTSSNQPKRTTAVCMLCVLLACQ